MNGRRSGQDAVIRQVGFNSLPVVVEAIGEDGVAITRNRWGRRYPVRTDISRGKGPLPRVGETWTIDRTLGDWTFEACLKAKPPTVSGSRGGNEALQSLLEALAEAGLIIDETTA